MAQFTISRSATSQSYFSIIIHLSTKQSITTRRFRVLLSCQLSLRGRKQTKTASEFVRKHSKYNNRLFGPLGVKCLTYHNNQKILQPGLALCAKYSCCRIILWLDGKKLYKFSYYIFWDTKWHYADIFCNSYLQRTSTWKHTGRTIARIQQSLHRSPCFQFGLFLLEKWVPQLGGRHISCNVLLSCRSAI